MQRLGDDLHRLPGSLASGGKPWVTAAVSVVVIGILLLVTELARRPAAELLPAYAATYLLVGLCMFGPTLKDLRTAQILSFVAPGPVMVILWALGTGYWGGLWLLGLPGWAIICLDWGHYNRRQRILRPLLFLVLLAAASAVFVTAAVYPNFSAFLLPLIPLVRLADRDYRARIPPALTEVALTFAVIVVAVTQPSSGWTWPPSYVGGAILGCGLVLAGVLRWSRKRPRARRINGGVVL